MDTKELWQVAKELVGEEELTRRFRLWIGNLIRVAKQKGSNKAVAGRYDTEIGEILSDLNERAKRRFQASEPCKAMIIARIKEGATVQDFQRVHMVKIGQWYGDPKSESWIRPSTLYRPSHFWEYLAEWDGDAQKKAELQQKREQYRKRAPAGNTERKVAMAKLQEKAWFEFESFADFLRHCFSAPDAKALAEYEMPDTLREMRLKFTMMMVLKNEIPDWAEEQYKLLQEKMNG